MPAQNYALKAFVSIINLPSEELLCLFLHVHLATLLGEKEARKLLHTSIVLSSLLRLIQCPAFVRRSADKKGIAWSRRRAWIRCRLTNLTIWRIKADGSPGCSVPCIFCWKELHEFDPAGLSFYVSEEAGWYRGRLQDVGAKIVPQITTGQRQHLGWQRKPDQGGR